MTWVYLYIQSPIWVVRHSLRCLHGNSEKITSWYNNITSFFLNTFKHIDQISVIGNPISALSDLTSACECSSGSARRWVTSRPVHPGTAPSWSGCHRYPRCYSCCSTLRTRPRPCPGPPASGWSCSGSGCCWRPCRRRRCPDEAPRAAGTSSMYQMGTTEALSTHQNWGRGDRKTQQNTQNLVKFGLNYRIVSNDITEISC